MGVQMELERCSIYRFVSNCSRMQHGDIVYDAERLRNEIHKLVE